MKEEIGKVHACDVSYLPKGTILKNKSRTVKVQSLQLTADKRWESDWNRLEQNTLRMGLELGSEGPKSVSNPQIRFVVFKNSELAANFSYKQPGF